MGGKNVALKREGKKKKMHKNHSENSDSEYCDVCQPKYLFIQRPR